MNNSMCLLKKYETEKETAILIYYQVGRIILSYQKKNSSFTNFLSVGSVVADLLFIDAPIVCVGFAFAPGFVIQ